MLDIKARYDDLLDSSNQDKLDKDVEETYSKKAADDATQGTKAKKETEVFRASKHAEKPFPKSPTKMPDTMADHETTPPNAPTIENEVFETSKNAQSTNPTPQL